MFFEAFARAGEGRRVENTSCYRNRIGCGRLIGIYIYERESRERGWRHRRTVDEHGVVRNRGHRGLEVKASTYRHHGHLIAVRPEQVPQLYRRAPGSTLRQADTRLAPDAHYVASVERCRRVDVADGTEAAQPVGHRSRFRAP